MGEEEYNPEDDGIMVNPKESVKLKKMAKGYQWEIKLIGDQLSEEHFERLVKYDKILKDKYGVE